MFRTFDNGEVVLPLDFDGEYLWNYVELVNYSAFLFVKYKVQSDGDSFDQMIFLPDSYALLRFKLTPNIIVTEGYLAFPESESNGGGWQLSRFTDVFQATDVTLP